MKLHLFTGQDNGGNIACTGSGIFMFIVHCFTLYWSYTYRGKVKECKYHTWVYQTLAFVLDKNRVQMPHPHLGKMKFSIIGRKQISQRNVASSICAGGIASWIL